MQKTFFLNILLYLLFLPILKAEEVSAPHIKVELVSEENNLVPGKEQHFAFRMAPDKDWHVYWKYQGDTGSPPKFTWEQNEEINFADIAWPLPEKIQVGHLVNYGYSREVLLLLPLKVSDRLKPGDKIKLKAKASWLVCQEECIPGKAEFEKEMLVATAAEKTTWEYKFTEERRNMPVNIPGLSVNAFKVDQSNFTLNLSTAQGLNVLRGEAFFIPSSGKQVENAAEQTVSIKNNVLSIKLQKPVSDPFPKNISGLMVAPNGWTDNYRQGVEVSAELNDATFVDGIGSSKSILPAIIFAFIGGLILNLMPCVLPILSIKILGFVNKADKDRAKIVRHGLSFALGVIISFWVLAAALIAFRLSGIKLGWGFQLQSPAFLIFMIGLLFIIGLNLYGFFEFGSKLQNIFGKYSGDGYSGSFLSGVLATVLATPCTAPFMGTAIAVSLASSSLIAFVIFTFLGLGMALPYVILSASPGLLKFIPKPGPWMEKFKQFLSFPIFATVIWLVGVYLKLIGQQYTTMVLMGLLMALLAVWVLNNVKIFRRTSALLLFMFSIYIALPARDGKADYDWKTYSNKTLNEHVDARKAVFIDFTAEWCLTCKLNKYVALDTKAVHEKFKEKGVVMLKADWTAVDDEITEAIKSYGRSGVPLNVLYYGGRVKEPYIFPAVLTPSLVLTELEKIGKN